MRGSIFVLFVLLFIGCSSSKYSLPITTQQIAKDREIDGAEIYSLDVIREQGVFKSIDYTISYTIVGQITPEYWHGHHMLKKVRQIEENCDYEMVGYDKRIILTPVQDYFVGKAGMRPPPFRIENTCVIKKDSANPLKKILFVSGDKEFLLELE